MNQTDLYIKNMVCPRCIKVIKDEFDKINIPIHHIELGKLSTPVTLNKEQKQSIKEILEINGFELIEDKKDKLVDTIKTLIIDKIHHNNYNSNSKNINNSDYIASEIGYDYSYLSNLFSAEEGITIEKYIINQKIEKAKELLLYNELTLNEISDKLEYSSVQHLSNQFKKVTGLTPSQFKKQKENSRKPLDQV
ncbi:MAG: helix-turn-helix domain-containing protein [Bacteroidales bacterium]